MFGLFAWWLNLHVTSGTLIAIVISYSNDPLSPSLPPTPQTRIFASNLKERMAQRFYNLVLLPRVRDDIAEYKRLNFHLYMALKKALFKPGAWFKGDRLGRRNREG